MRAIKIKKIWILDIALIIISLIAFFGFWDHFSKVISPFIYALVLAYILNPLVNFLEKKENKKEMGGFNRFRYNTDTFIIIFCFGHS
jgi:Domain of unknown function DUF20.